MSDEQKPPGGSSASGGEGDAGGQRARRRRRPRRRPKTGGHSPVAAPENTGSSPQSSRQASSSEGQQADTPAGESKRRRPSRGRRRSRRSAGQTDGAPGTEATASTPGTAKSQATTEGEGEGKSKSRRRRRRRPTAGQPPVSGQSPASGHSPASGQPRPADASRAAAAPAKRRRSAGRQLAPADKPAPEAASPETSLAFPDEDGWATDDELPQNGPEVAGAGPRPELSLLEEPEVQLDPDGADEFVELEEDAPPARGTLANLVRVQMREGAKVFAFDAGTLQLTPGEQIVVDSELGLAIGQVAQPPQPQLTGEPARPVLRRVDQNDSRQQARNLLREQEAFEYCQQRIAHRRLPMKLIRVEYIHGGNKAVFFFAAENRIDFRDLVKDLAQRLHTRIVMRQVGVRDESRMTGGIGSCGCELCCSTWLPRFEPVSIRMAKDQGLVLNPQKVSGQCGRLKCCLTYEQHQYQEVRKGLPKPGRRVSTPDGEGRVQELDVLRQLVRVSLSDGSMQTFPANQVKPIAAPGTPPRPAKPAADE